MHTTAELDTRLPSETKDPILHLALESGSVTNPAHVILVPPSTGPLLGFIAAITPCHPAANATALDPASPSCAPDSCRVMLPIARPEIAQCTTLDDNHEAGDEALAPPNRQ